MTEDVGTNPTLRGHKLLLLVPFEIPQSWIDHLNSRFPHLSVVSKVTDFQHQDPDDALPEGVKWEDVTVLVTGSTIPHIGQAPRLKVVQLLSAGSNHVLGRPLFQDDPKVALCTANGVHGPQIAEWIITTYLLHQHNIAHYLDLQKQQTWAPGDHLPQDTVSSRVGILGYGAIGRQVARVAKAMGIDVHAYTLHPKNTPEERRDDTYTPPGLGDVEGNLPSRWFSGGSKEDLHTFLSSGLDLLVVAVPLTAKTTHLIGREEFEALSAKKTFVTNIARGPVVHTDSLIDALDKGVIRGAALDVTDPEPLPDGHPLWSAKNVIITPHISGRSSAYQHRIQDILELNLSRLSEDRPFVNRVNLGQGY
ncbi:Phosphoglycerate dehydrogenase or related dehydrogenase [Geosmithia morbida]|uniref:Phosphoglycerate dehydrogenase or related dehydrogenase n=1 Tax=Geosmithia morbida TaxID=1094350 RepID=A0A9P4YQU0_9HYPO|nr:Phosphoglycerate dehydrogenase or related dehydrogenase [Geosmithia morbida]KAF4121431.1 Phosphoglycerate dehydrogenase or related dehydrogenase [Geosmithia morbida]